MNRKRTIRQQALLYLHRQKYRGLVHVHEMVDVFRAGYRAAQRNGKKR